MKANAPKRKVFNDAVDMLTGGEPAAAGKGVQMLPVESIKPFHDHPFHLYEGERLDDMVESVQEHGILVPAIVRTAPGGYEMLAGHNRLNAARLAGLAEIPAIVKEGLPDAEAYVYVIETNMLQRSISAGERMVMKDIYGWCASHGIRYRTRFCYRPDFPVTANLWNFYSYLRGRSDMRRAGREATDV